MRNGHDYDWSFAGHDTSLSNQWNGHEFATSKWNRDNPHVFTWSMDGHATGESRRTLPPPIQPYPYSNGVLEPSYPVDEYLPNADSSDVVDNF